jgi:DNA-binding response OmpR family regulator
MDDGIRGKRIMVVDDEHDLTLFYRMCCEYYGFEVETYNDPRRALTSFRSDYYNLIIFAIKMPDMDGFELYREINAKDPNVKACFLTANELYYKEFRSKEYSALKVDRQPNVAGQSRI